MKRTNAIILISLLTTLLNAQSLLQSGPMLGYSELREVAIWVQTTNSANVYIEYWQPHEPEKKYTTSDITTEKEKAFTAILIADQVEPGNRYQYRLVINNETVELPYPTKFQTQPLWRWRTDPPEFSFATGSCAYINEAAYDRPGNPYGSEYEIFEAINESKPDFMIWLGDNMYLREPDWNSWTGITKRWTHSRSVPEMQPLLASAHHYAIWDDHDYGPNNSDRGWWNKNQTYEAFQLFWANPSYGIGDMKGVITQFQWNDVDFILLDNRYYRTPNKLIAENKTILGEQQKQWLKDALASSLSTFKVVAMGGQFLNDVGKYETYSNNGFEKERQEIIDFIYKQQIKNVVFLTGDRHHTELSVLEEDGKPRIIDITVSALTSGAGHAREEANNLRVEGTYTNKHNYGLISFRGSEKDREMHIQILNKDGQLIWERFFQREK
ncbi:MAG TPA: phosphodiesterase [Bacteroidales bacterium]|jgi:alkaline phosphatase D|nr:phosphodiesterase [Bacteroidales bacterium]